MYSIKVTGGTAALAQAAAGTNVRIQADSPTGKTFAYWKANSGDANIDEPLAATTFFTMPEADVEIEAVFKDNLYDVKVIEGTAKPGEAVYGETVALHANTPDSGTRFKEWKVVAGAVQLSDATDSEATFAMPAENVKLEATYENVAYTVEVVNGTADKAEAIRGETVYLTANPAPDGKKFSHWEKVSGYDVDFKDPQSAVTTFAMPDVNVKVEAVYEDAPVPVEYDIHMFNGTTSASKATAGTEITVTAAAAPEGQVFQYWLDTRGEVLFDDETNATTTFFMPEDEVWVQPVYCEAGNAVHVFDGKADKAEASFKDVVTLVADPAPEGMEFACWVDVDGNIEYADQRNSQTTFLMPGTEVWIQATYRAVDPPSSEHKVTVLGGTASVKSAPAGATVSITLGQVPEGKQFDRWEVTAGGATLADPASPNTTFAMPDEDVNVQATYKDAPTPVPVEYRIVSGAGQTYVQGSGKGAAFTCNGPLEKFVALRIDGANISSDEYACESGSTVATLKASYLDALTVGEHSIQFVYNDGESDVAPFTVAKDNDDPVGPITPVTGDPIYPMLLIAIAAAAIATAAIARRFGRSSR